MILGSVYAEGHSKNSLFQEADPTHRFNPTFTNRLLREEFRRTGVEINTADLNAGRRVDFEIYFEGSALASSALPRFLVALENPHINPLNANPEYFTRFHRVFTWNSRFFSMSNVREVSVPNHFAMGPWPAYDERRIFSTLINANKRFKSDIPNDLYVERVAVIRWYEQHAPQHFELYGLGWNKPRHDDSFLGRVKRRGQRLATQLFGYRPFPSWRGEVEDKSAVLLNSKFSYCYENVYGLTGYITEKMIDSMMNGCIPVYWGADNVGERIPPDCFIDRRHFADTAATHEFLLAMSAKEYAGRQQAMRDFLHSERGQKFGSAQFVRTIVDEVATELKVCLNDAGESTAQPSTTR